MSTDADEAMSSYLQYLPAVLWRKSSPPAGVEVGQLLRVFEKLLTGIDDGQQLVHRVTMPSAAPGDPPEAREHLHPPLEETIDRLHRLFDPWATPPELLHWLASWVSLPLPDNWTEPRQRRAIAHVVEIYRRRGAQEGLRRSLALVSGEPLSPRIGIDHGDTILALKPGQSTASLLALLSGPPLIHPRCLVAAPDGTLFVGDSQTPLGAQPSFDNRLWRIRPAGEARQLYLPRPREILPPDGKKYARPVALAMGPGDHPSLFLLTQADSANEIALYEIPAPYTQAQQRLKKSELGVVLPVAMVASAGRLVILDRGESLSGDAKPAIITIDPASGFHVERKPIAAPELLPEPLSLLAVDDYLVVGDGGRSASGDNGRANLVRVQAAAGGWAAAARLLPANAAANQLVAPVSLEAAGDGSLLVLDLGLKPHYPQPPNRFLRDIAVSPAIFRARPVDAANSWQLDRAADGSRLVTPTAIVRYQHTFFVADAGDYADKDEVGNEPRDWRTRRFEFGVIVHFARQPDMDPSRFQHLIQDTVRSIRDVVSTERPAHTFSTLLYQE